VHDDVELLLVGTRIVDDDAPDHHDDAPDDDHQGHNDDDGPDHGAGFNDAGHIAGVAGCRFHAGC
jgi:hypothetical protein